MFPLIFGLLTIITTSPSDAQQLASPCPNLFTYEPEGVVGDHWYGNIRIVSTAELSGLWLRSIFDRPVAKLESDFGEVVQREPAEFLIRRPKNKINKGETISIRIRAQFDPASGDVPQLAGFRVNGEVRCPENGVIPTSPPAPAVLISPCPAIFAYEPPGSESDRWYGVIQIASTRELNGVWLRVILDQPSSQLGNWFGEVTTDDNKEYLIKNRNFKVKLGTSTPLRFFVKYNAGEPVPKLMTIRLNAEQVCPEAGASSGAAAPQPQQPTQSTWVPPAKPTPSRPVFGGDFDPGSRPDFLPARDPTTGFECGVVASKPRPLITYGEVTVEGQWPWHAALYYPEGTGLQYICGASLVSLKHVLTVGHCVAQRLSNDPVANEDIEVYLGKWSLKKFSSKGIQNIQINKIFMHPQYDHLTYRNDIALIRLSRPAEYTDWVRPVCLWAENTDISAVVNRDGTVVGWGYDQTGKVTEQLNKAIMPVVPHDKCIWSNTAFFSKFATNTTFCAGDRKGTSVCNGDSGGGLVFPKRNSNPNQVIWQIRGLVSISIALQSDLICDTSHYAIFTDVAKYIDWIRRSMRA